MTNIVTKTLTTAAPTFDITFSKPMNVAIEGTFGGGTVSHTIEGTSTSIRAGATSADTYRTTVQHSTFTIAGSTGATVTVTMEPTDV